MNVDIFEIFQAHIAARPDATALIDAANDERISFRELDELSARIRHWLQSQGIGREDFVQVHLPRSPKAYIAAIGILKAGAAFVICDEDMPAERVAFIRKDCNCKAVIDSNAWDAAMACTPACGWSEADEHDAAFAVYTSGSTGTPKGILHERGKFMCCWRSACYGGKDACDSTDTWAVLTPLSFVTFIFQSVVLIIGGTPLVVAPYRVLKDPASLLQFLDKYGITITILTASYVRLLGHFNPQMRRVYVCGEPANDIYMPTPELLNLHGMSECAINTTLFLIDRRYTLTPVGKPHFPLRIAILDEEGREVPDGTEGEYCFENTYTRGYINQPEMTAKAWRDDGLFHSGDMARRLPDGNYVITGRVDQMIKIAGNRVEPAEVEAAVKKVLGVDWCTVLPYRQEGETLLCAYYKSGTILDFDTARKALADILPIYMLPACFMQIDEIPLTDRGKLDRHALPKPETRQADIVAPADDAERELLDIVREHLKVAAIGVTTNLFSAGLTSMAAMRITFAITQYTGKRLRVTDLLQHPTIREWASLESLEEITPDTEEREFYPLTDNQRGVYIDWEQQRNTTQYNLPLRIRFNEKVSAERLENAVKAVVDAHPVLKAHLVLHDGEVMIQRRDTAVIPVQVLPSPAGVEPFDLLAGDLCRFGIHTDAEGIITFYAEFHHIICDGSSVVIFLHDLEQALQGIRIEAESYTAFHEAIREQQQSESSSADGITYFDRLVEGLSSTRYPVSKNPDGRCYSSLLHTFSNAQIKKFCRQKHLTESSFFLTVLLQVLHRVTREDSIMVMTTSDNRTASRINRTIGMFLKTLPVVNRPNPRAGFADEAMLVQQQMFSTLANASCSFAGFYARHGIQQQVLYIYQGGIYDSIALQGAEVTPMETDQPIFPLLVNVAPDGTDGYLLNIEYDGNIYGSDDIQQLAGMIQTFAADACREGAVTCDLALLPPQEEQRMLALSRGETISYDESRTFIDLFLMQIRHSPDKLAVADENKELTYTELDRLSNIVAHYLISHGVQPDDLVAVMLDRTVHFPTAIIGIMKAGAAYVPVAPDYPEDRKQFIIADCEAKVVIDDALINEIICGGFDDTPANLATPAGRAYMIYTSGSTGKPKGTVIPHRALSNFVQAFLAVNPISQEDRISEHSSFSFDASVEELCPALAAGASVHIMSESIRKDVEAIHRFLTEHHITGGGFTTRITELLLQQYDLPLRYIVAGGEKLQQVVGNHTRILNTYGPTECTVDATFFNLEQGKRYEDIPIGRPMPNGTCLVLDRYGKLLPQGIEGELWFVGPQVGCGYWNQPALTGEKFVPCPYLPGQMMFKTGDLVRWNPDGLLEFVGRIDNQVKLRGFRIEPDEIESAAFQVEGVQQAVAVVRNERLILYYTSAADDDTGADNLNGRLSEALSSSLPEYMVPGAFVRLDEMPLTPNGKIDRKTLPEPEYIQEEYIAPESRNEKLLCRAIEELLGLGHIGITDSFRSCGMSSIQAIRLNMTLHKMGIHVNLGAIMKADNVSNLCQFIDKGIDNSDVGGWMDEFDAKKPTIALCCGTIGSDKITVYLAPWVKKYNVYVLQPIFNAWTDVEVLSHEDIITRYLELIRQDIRGKILCIMGFSYGGELAYHLAVRWQKHTGQKPMVFMGDTVKAGITSFNNMQQSLCANEMEAYFYKLESDFFSKRERLSVPDYRGRVILISAEKESPYRTANEQEWIACNAHIYIIPVNDTHQGLFENAEHYDEYLSLIENNVSEE